MESQSLHHPPKTGIAKPLKLDKSNVVVALLAATYVLQPNIASEDDLYPFLEPPHAPLLG